MMMDKLCKITDIQRLVNQYEIEFEKLHGLCLNEGMALCSLTKKHKLSSGELSETLGLTHSNTSKVIASVERKGYVERVIGQEDKRHMYFTITAKGREALERIHKKELEIPDALDNLISGTK